jgi:FkbM family methyltransferase
MLSRSAARERARRVMRPVFEAVGSDRLSRPALFDLDRKLGEILDFDGGVFIEAGANDGFEQSNTYRLERFRGWSGVLVEGIPELALACRRRRRRSVVFNCALVPPELEGTDVTMHYANLMSIVQGARGDEESDSEHVAAGERLQELQRYAVTVRGRTLSSVINEAGVTGIDFLSLDLEGYELPALRGLDLTRHAPTHMLIEALDGEAVAAALDEYLAPAYDRVGLLSPHDIHYRRRS